MISSNAPGWCSVLVPSCDKYSDLWRPFFTLFWRNWADCPFPVCLGSNELVFADERIQTIAVGADPGWSAGARRMLGQIPTPYVLIMLDDFFLRRPVSTSRILALLETLRRLDGHMLRLVRKRRPDFPVDGFPDVGRINNMDGAPYCVSLQATLWRREFLLALLRDDETIWQFETEGSARAQDLPPGFYTVRHDALDYGRHVVQGGQWFWWDVRRHGRMNIGCDFSRRPIMSPWGEIAWRLGRVRKMALNAIPWKTRRKTREWLRKLRNNL